MKREIRLLKKTCCSTGWSSLSSNHDGYSPALGFWCCHHTAGPRPSKTKLTLMDETHQSSLKGNQDRGRRSMMCQDETTPFTTFPSIPLSSTVPSLSCIGDKKIMQNTSSLSLLNEQQQLPHWSECLWNGKGDMLWRKSLTCSRQNKYIILNFKLCSLDLHFRVVKYCYITVKNNDVKAKYSKT